MGFIHQEDTIRYIKQRGVTGNDLNEIAYAVIARAPDFMISVSTLDDEFKIKLLLQAYKKYSLTHLENLLKTH